MNMEIFDCLLDSKNPTMQQLIENPDRLYYFQPRFPNYYIVKFIKENKTFRYQYANVKCIHSGANMTVRPKCLFFKKNNKMLKLL